jgi:catechol 2,3-dioxygenase-like lactoylglutathione lyase family enzyme
MDWKLEVVVVPVSNVGRAIEFYRDRVGFALDMHQKMAETLEMAQLTPPGSGCSITVSTGMVDMEPGVIKGLQLVVPDIATARAQLLQRGVEVSPIRHVDKDGDFGWKDGPGGRWNSFIFFDDPDGNSWVVQERPADE